MTRNILDLNGIVIGQLTLPDETTEDVWTAALAPYAAPVSDPAEHALIDTIILSEASNVTTSSGTAATVGALSSKPVAGTYVVDFTGNAFTGGASAQGEFGIYVDGVLLAETRREFKCNLTLLGGLVTISLNSIGVGTCTGTQVALNGNQTVDVRFKSNNGGTIGFSERVLKLMRVK
jgi:hypothetical protein